MVRSVGDRKNRICDISTWNRFLDVRTAVPTWDRERTAIPCQHVTIFKRKNLIQTTDSNLRLKNAATSSKHAENNVNGTIAQTDLKRTWKKEWIRMTTNPYDQISSDCRPGFGRIKPRQGCRRPKTLQQLKIEIGNTQHMREQTTERTNGAHPQILRANKF